MGNRHHCQVLAVLLLLGSHVPAEEIPAARSSAREAPDRRTWRTPACCSVNAMYIALRMHASDVDVRYEAVEDHLRTGEPGNSLGELRACAAAFGVETEVVKITPEKLKQCRFPIIAHFEEERGQLGHFVVVTAMGKESVEYIDGTSAILQVVPRSVFCKDWSGYALIFQERNPHQWLSATVLVLGVFSLGIGLWSWRRLR